MNTIGTEANIAAVSAELPLLATRIRAEYDEMPGLSLTLGQAARFWNLDPSTCKMVLSTLVEQGCLRKSGGRYLRAS